MRDYSKSKIYFIQSTKDNLIYIGSTTRKFHERIDQHKRDNTCSQIILRQPDCEYGIIEDYPCNSSEELRWRERYWLEKCMNCFNVVNEVLPIRSDEEKKEYHRVWEANNINRNLRNGRKQKKRDWRWSFGRYEGKTWMWDNNLLDIDINIFH
tara:strand:- start:175 stop:633 length:459 start_codon:yes stop_codon:yes gene_type:complete